MFYLTTHSTHFIYGYMASDIRLKYHTDSERGNPLPPHGLLFPINSKSSFICTIPQTGLHIPRPLWSTGWNEKSSTESLACKVTELHDARSSLRVAFLRFTTNVNYGYI